jgi:hypothetical protein
LFSLGESLNPRRRGKKTHEMRSNITREQRPLIRLGQTLQQCLQPNLIHKRLGNGTAHDALLAAWVIEQIRVFELGLELIQLHRELVGNGRARFGALQALVLAPDALELGRSVFGDLGLDVFDVALIELRRFTVLEDHEVGVFLIRESQASEHF